MRRWIRIVGFTVLISLILLLSSCGALKPLLTEEEVLSSLSERYGTDFIVYRDNVETLLSDIDKTIYGIGEE